MCVGQREVWVRDIQQVLEEKIAWGPLHLGHNQHTHTQRQNKDSRLQLFPLGGTCSISSLLLPISIAWTTLSPLTHSLTHSLIYRESRVRTRTDAHNRRIPVRGADSDRPSAHGTRLVNLSTSPGFSSVNLGRLRKPTQDIPSQSDHGGARRDCSGTPDSLRLVVIVRFYSGDCGFFFLFKSSIVSSGYRRSAAPRRENAKCARTLSSPPFCAITGKQHPISVRCSGCLVWPPHSPLPLRFNCTGLTRKEQQPLRRISEVRDATASAAFNIWINLALDACRAKTSGVTFGILNAGLRGGAVIPQGIHTGWTLKLAVDRYIFCFKILRIYSWCV